MDSSSDSDYEGTAGGTSEKFAKNIRQFERQRAVNLQQSLSPMQPYYRRPLDVAAGEGTSKQSDPFTESDVEDGERSWDQLKSIMGWKTPGSFLNHPNDSLLNQTSDIKSIPPIFNKDDMKNASSRHNQTSSLKSNVKLYKKADIMKNIAGTYNRACSIRDDVAAGEGTSRQRESFKKYVVDIRDSAWDQLKSILGCNDVAAGEVTSRQLDSVIERAIVSRNIALNKLKSVWGCNTPSSLADQTSGIEGVKGSRRTRREKRLKLVKERDIAAGEGTSRQSDPFTESGMYSHETAWNQLKYFMDCDILSSHNQERVIKNVERPSLDRGQEENSVIECDGGANACTGCQERRSLMEWVNVRPSWAPINEKNQLINQDATLSEVTGEMPKSLEECDVPSSEKTTDSPVIIRLKKASSKSTSKQTKRPLESTSPVKSSKKPKCKNLRSEKLLETITLGAFHGEKIGISKKCLCCPHEEEEIENLLPVEIIGEKIRQEMRDYTSEIRWKVIPKEERQATEPKNPINQTEVEEKSIYGKSSLAVIESQLFERAAPRISKEVEIIPQEKILEEIDWGSIRLNEKDSSNSLYKIINPTTFNDMNTVQNADMSKSEMHSNKKEIMEEIIVDIVDYYLRATEKKVNVIPGEGAANKKAIEKKLNYDYVQESISNEEFIENAVDNLVEEMDYREIEEEESYLIIDEVGDDVDTEEAEEVSEGLAIKEVADDVTTEEVENSVDRFLHSKNTEEAETFGDQKVLANTSSDKVDKDKVVVEAGKSEDKIEMNPKRKLLQKWLNT